MGLVRGLVLLAVLVAHVPVLHAAESPDPSDDFGGPLGALQLHPLRHALLDVMNRGTVARPWFRAERNVANTWNAETHLSTGPGGQRTMHVVDGQLESLWLDAGVPVGDFLAFGLRGGVSRLWGGGAVDQSIEDFHQTFDFYNFYRHRAPANRTTLGIVHNGRTVLDWRGDRFLLQNLTLTTFLRALENRTTRVLVRSDVRLPVGDLARALGLSTAEVSAGLAVWQRFRRLVAFHLAGNVILHDKDRPIGGLRVQELQFDAELSLELRVLPGFSLLLEDKLQSPLFERSKHHVLLRESLPLRATAWNAYFTPVNIISGGARLHLPEGTRLSVFVGEDFMFCTACATARYSRETNAPDISLSMVLEKTWHRLD